MSFFRSYIAPLLIVLTFVIAMLAVSARIFLPGDMMAPAPVEEPIGQPLETPPAAPANPSQSTEAEPEISWLLKGLPDEVS